MKVRIDKRVEGGKYFVDVSVLELSNEEREKIRKFGSPLVSMEPQRVWYDSHFTFNLPLHDINQSFGFENQALADTFAEKLRERILQALNSLRNKQDTFSSSEAYEL